jgi:carboxyl-terminal processing protease
MSRRVVVLAVICLCLFSNIFAQTAPKSVTQLPPNAVEPFKLERGSSFSASTSRHKTNNSVSTDANETARTVIVQDFEDALDIIRHNYINGTKIDDNELTKSSLTAMLRTLDPHSNYYDTTDYQELLTDQHSEYIGIGCSIANYINNGVVETFITSTHPGSAAFRAGLRFGDRFIAIDGEKISGKISSLVREKIRGAKGTSVRLTIERAATLKVETIEIKRQTVPQPSLPDAYLIRPEVGYIDLSNGFNFTTIDELNVALSDLHDQGMKYLILDLRDNPGGIVEQAVRVAGKFLPAGKNIVSQRARIAGDNQVWRSKDSSPENVPLVVLVNGNSASASEIVTAALQDYDRALIVGEKTFGKGLVQSVIDLPDGAGLTLTTAKYYTPSGRSIQRDYSNIGTYDYFKHKIDFTEKSRTGVASQTITGRPVYSGDGITPDETVKLPELTANQISLIDPMFFFSRELVNGRIKGLESYKTLRPIQYGQRIRPSDFPVTAELFDAFKNFVSQNSSPKYPIEQLESDKKFIVERLRYNLGAAAFGNVAATQILIEKDLQVSKAIELLSRAQNLFAQSKRILSKSNK